MMSFYQANKITESVLNVNYLDGNREEYNKKYDNYLHMALYDTKMAQIKY